MTRIVDQDTGNGIRPNQYHCVEIHQPVAQLDYILHEIGNQVGGC